MIDNMAFLCYIEMISKSKEDSMESILRKILTSACILFAVGVAIVILAGVALASLVLGMVLGVACWKLAIVILATVIVTKLFD